MAKETEHHLHSTCMHISNTDLDADGFEEPYTVYSFKLMQQFHQTIKRRTSRSPSLITTLDSKPTIACCQPTKDGEASKNTLGSAWDRWLKTGLWWIPSSQSGGEDRQHVGGRQ
ncbi:hypothetical protein BaRGS_00001309 [Batillaria attramentaria]|uniref:Uncharacterized protein n=1 Tax=Batillaria attramentaria TaxID=370345 RepID=A0ABD0M6G9_9CAEN